VEAGAGEFLADRRWRLPAPQEEVQAGAGFEVAVLSLAAVDQLVDRVHLVEETIALRYAERARVQLSVTCCVMASIVAGMLCGEHEAIAVPLAVILVMAGAFAGAISSGAAMAGVLSGFGVVIGIGVAGSPADEPLRRAVELLIGAAFAMTLTLAPWPWEPLRPARRAITTAWNRVAALWEAPAGEREAAELAALSALAGARAALPREADCSYEASLERCGESFERAVAETRAGDSGGAAGEGAVSRREAGQLRPSRGSRSESRSPSSLFGRALILVSAQLTLDSALCRHAIRLGVAVAVALLLVPLVDRSNGAWMVTGALIVMKPAFGGTLKTARQRALGTVVGAAIAGAVAALTSDPWVLLMLALLATWLAESIIRLSFTLFAVFITPLSILLANVLVPGNWEIAWQRTLDVGVGVGAGIGILVSVLVLPRPLRASLLSKLRAAAGAVADFFEAVHIALREGGGDTHGSRAAAERSLADLTITISQLGDEPRAWRQGAIPAAEALRAPRAAVETLPRPSSVDRRVARTVGSIALTPSGRYPPATRRRYRWARKGS
jgi:uncharacterized membrane protein YccC